MVPIRKTRVQVACPYGKLKHCVNKCPHKACLILRCVKTEDGKIERNVYYEVVLLSVVHAGKHLLWEILSA